MLVLHRKKGESLKVGDNIEITVTEITSDGVKLAIEAPRDIKIWRNELYEASKANFQSVAGRVDIAKMRSLIKGNIKDSE